MRIGGAPFRGKRIPPEALLQFIPRQTDLLTLIKFAPTTSQAPLWVMRDTLAPNELATN